MPQFTDDALIGSGDEGDAFVVHVFDDPLVWCGSSSYRLVRRLGGRTGHFSERHLYSMAHGA